MTMEIVASAWSAAPRVSAKWKSKVRARPDFEHGPTKCSLIVAESTTDVFNACLAICGQDELYQLFNQDDDFANLCASDHTCTARRRPVKVNR
jgi:hypothetical protein